MKQVSITISGRVQGVFFRANAKALASQCDLKGFVRNEGDGSVFIEAEGDEKNLETFILWCKKGPKAAEVERVEVKEGEVKGYSSFDILYD